MTVNAKQKRIQNSKTKQWLQKNDHQKVVKKIMDRIEQDQPLTDHERNQKPWKFKRTKSFIVSSLLPLYSFLLDFYTHLHVIL